MTAWIRRRPLRPRRPAAAERRPGRRNPVRGMFLSPRQARALLTDPPCRSTTTRRAFLACNYDPAKALCHPGPRGQEAPPVTRPWTGAIPAARTSPAPTSTLPR